MRCDRPSFFFVSALALALCLLPACSVSMTQQAPPDPYAGLDNPDPLIRLDSIKRLAKKKDPKAIPLLIGRLRDEESPVRYYAGLALRRITDQNFGFEAYAPVDRREEAVGKWEAWWAGRQGGSVPDASPRIGTGR